MQRTDCRGTPFQYYPAAQLLGLKGRLYCIRARDREEWRQSWAAMDVLGSDVLITVAFCRIEGEGPNNFAFENAFPGSRCHVMVGFARPAVEYRFRIFVLSSDSLRDYYEPFRHAYVDRTNSKWRRVQRWMKTTIAKLRQQRALALAMAWHGRLGMNAAISCLTVDLARMLM
jgi:hypothetical protein